jgi:uncharacterized membrane protein YccC
MATLPPDPPHILKAKQAAAEAGLDLEPAFTALNLAAQFYHESPPAAAPDEELAKLRRILRNARQRYRQLKEILAAEDIPDAKKVKKVRFVVNLLLPEKEQDDKKAPA